MNSGKLFLKIGLALVSFTSICESLQAQTQLSVDEQQTVLIAFADAIKQNYVIPEQGKAYAAALATALRDGTFSTPASPSDFLEQSNQLIQATHPDKHLGLLSPAKFKQMMEMFYGENDETVQPEVEASNKHHATKQTGHKKVTSPRQRDGNGLAEIGVLNVSEISRDGLNQTGYIAFSRFDGSARAQAFIHRVFNTFAESDNLIIDLRQCGGGDAEMVKALSHYFFVEPTHLLSSVMPAGEDGVRPIKERWTQPNELSAYFAEKPLTILISSKTFSAAESFSFGMQASGRATLIGEPTGGGGYMNDFFPLAEGFGASISVGRTYDPRTGKGWQGAGVQPDLKVEADHALKHGLDRYTIKSGKLAALKGQQRGVYEHLQAFTNAWYGADDNAMQDLLDKDFIRQLKGPDGEVKSTVDQKALVLQTGRGQGVRQNKIHYNRIISDIQVTGETASATLILRETKHAMQLVKINGTWKITRELVWDKSRS